MASARQDAPPPDTVRACCETLGLPAATARFLALASRRDPWAVR